MFITKFRDFFKIDRRNGGLSDGNVKETEVFSSLDLKEIEVGSVELW